MNMHIQSFRYCIDCNKKMTFNEFCRDNPSLNKKKAIEYWNNTLYSIHCPNCFFNHSAKPFKIKKGYQRYKTFLLKKF